MGQILSKYRSGKLPKAFKVIPSLTNWEEVSVKLIDFLVPANFSEHTGKILISRGVLVNKWELKFIWASQITCSLSVGLKSLNENDLIIISCLKHLRLQDEWFIYFLQSLLYWLVIVKGRGVSLNWFTRLVYSKLFLLHWGDFS